MAELTTRASSINRAMDQIGDKWCLLILQEVLWGINTFNEMMLAIGVSRGVLSNRLQWLQDVGCLRRQLHGGRPRYHMTRKSIELYSVGMMAISWERSWYDTPELDQVELVHLNCGQAFHPEMRCSCCQGAVDSEHIEFHPGPGASRDVREKKIRRRSSKAIAEVPSTRNLYRNLINVVGDRWSSNVIALAYHGISRFEAFHAELPVATNILSDRLQLLVGEGILEQSQYQRRPARYEYLLTAKGRGLYPWFQMLLQWGDRWCDEEQLGPPMMVIHQPCGQSLGAEVCCSACQGLLNGHEVRFSLAGHDAAVAT